MARISTFLIIAVLIAGTVRCVQPAQYNLTISTTEGGEITTPGDGTFSYEEGTEVPLVAFPHTGHRFVEWTGDVDTIANVEDASTTITMNDDYSVTANFVKQYDLTISSTAGGSVTMPGEATYAYDEGEVVNLVAQAEEGYHFVNWTGDVSTITNVDAATTSIIMGSDYLITANFVVDVYFLTDTCLSLEGPRTLPTEERNPCIILEILTNVVVANVRVDLPDGRSIVIPPYTEFSPGVNGKTELHFFTCAAGMPVAGGEYIFTGLDMAGEPIPGARDTDIWVGVEPPDPPTNVRAEVIENGILVSWDESEIIPGSFEPAVEPQLGCYQLMINRIETGEFVYGANGISESPHLVPGDKANFIEWGDFGRSLSEMEDGTYYIAARVLSIAPAGSSGKGLEYNNSDPGQIIIFTIQNGEITTG